MTSPPIDGVDHPIAVSLAPEMVVALARRTHAIDVDDVRLIGGEWAANARLRLRDGSRRMFKAVAARGVDHRDRLASLYSWRGSLADAAAAGGLPAAAPLRDVRDLPVSITEVDGTPLIVVISPWMPGIPLATADLDEQAARAARESLGSHAAQMTRVLRDLPAPATDTRHEWSFEDMADTIGEALNDPTARESIGDADLAAVRTLTERFRRAMTLAGDLPVGLTHHDLNDFNVLVQPETGSVTGIVDFDDARVAPAVSEVAIAAGYAMLGARDPVGALLDVVRGAVESGPLTEAEAEVVLPGAATRLCLNAVLWTARANSNGSYGSARMARTWPVVRSLAAIDWSAAQRRVVATASASATMTE